MADHPYYPIIYVRGYAGTQGAIEDTVATPYMGFNLGSTKYRQTTGGEIEPYVFESPLIRLMKDHNYRDAYHDGNLKPQKPVDPRSIWIFRYYDLASKAFSQAKGHEIEFYAQELGKFIDYVRTAIGMDNDDGFRVYLVAHSMGGLVCRCYLQNKNIPDLDGNKSGDWKKKGVDKLFTYATPHGGIEFRKGLGWLEGFRDFFDINNSGNFGPERMSQFLDVSHNNLKSLNNQFPAERVFCLVGTNPEDYNVARKAVGPQSDGLVQIENAYVQNAARAYTYRSHSGHHGIVNSESGYCNLERFLFGNVRASVAIDKVKIPVPGGKNISATYNIENIVSIRGLAIPINKRTMSTFSSTFRTQKEIVSQKTHLFTSYLWSERRVRRRSQNLGFSIRFCILPRYVKEKKWWLDEHFEGQTVFDDHLILDIGKRRSGDVMLKYSWGSQARKATRPVELQKVGANYQAKIAFHRARPLKVSGEIVIEISPWNT